MLIMYLFMMRRLTLKFGYKSRNRRLVRAVRRARGRMVDAPCRQQDCHDEKLAVKLALLCKDADSKSLEFGVSGAEPLSTWPTATLDPFRPQLSCSGPRRTPLCPSAARRTSSKSRSTFNRSRSTEGSSAQNDEA